MQQESEREGGVCVCVCQPTFWCDAWTGPLEVERRSSALRILSNVRDDSAQRLLINILYHSILLSTWPCSAKHPGPSCGPKHHSIPSTTQPSFRLQSGSVCARPNFHEQVSTRYRPPAARCSLNHSAPKHPRLLGGESIDSEFRVYQVIGLSEAARRAYDRRFFSA